MSESQADAQTRNLSVAPDPFAAAYPPEGSNFGRYQDLRILGQGGMATVYRAFDPQLNLDVAVKILPCGLQLTQEKKQRFRQEVQLLAGLTIPGVIRVFDCGCVQGWEYFTMELVDGANLSEYQRTRDPELVEKIDIIRCLAQVVAALHAADIAHRDIKPGNIMMTSAGGLRLSDFGIAKCFAPDTRLDLTRDHSRHCTPSYMSPDLPSALKDLEMAKKADVYSLAVVAYEMLAGRLPYAVENLTPDECFVVIREESPTDLAELAADVPPSLRSVIMEALAKDPEHRPSAAEFAENLNNACIGGHGAPAKPILVPLTIILLSLLILVWCLLYYYNFLQRRPGPDAAGSHGWKMDSSETIMILPELMNIGTAASSKQP